MAAHGLYDHLDQNFRARLAVLQHDVDQALLSAEMFVAFSKKSPCRSLAEKFGQGITQMTTDDSYDAMVTEATKAWDASQGKN